jgi:hypothetical protein
MTLFSVLSLIGFTLASASGLLAVSSVLYAHAIGGFPFYDPRLLRIYRWGDLPPRLRRLDHTTFASCERAASSGVARSAEPAVIVAKGGRGGVGIGDGGHPVPGIVRKRDGVVQGVFDRSAVPMSVVAVGGDVALRVGDGGNQADGIVSEGGDVVERVGDGEQLTFLPYSHLARCAEIGAMAKAISRGGFAWQRLKALLPRLKLGASS